jgi:hypothetical protein
LCSDKCKTEYTKKDAFRLSVIADYRANQKSYFWMMIYLGGISIAAYIVAIAFFTRYSKGPAGEANPPNQV